MLKTRKRIFKNLRLIHKNAIRRGLNEDFLKQFNHVCNLDQSKKKPSLFHIISALVAVLVILGKSSSWINSIITSRCLLSTNFLVWEATRPISDCSYCKNVSKPVLLHNVTREEFLSYSYSPKPIIVANAIKHWKATKYFSFNFFKRLYQYTEGSYESLEDGCQFLNFKTDLFSLKDVFDMPEARAKNEPGQDPWYVGWGNCHPDILTKIRQYYDIPLFLPEDAEFPATENIFFGYEIGAVMHLDYISRLMWQGQVKGSKIWNVAPVPECEHVCNKLQFRVEPGDVVLLDTRIWYHATTIPKGEFSLTVQSEYG